LHRTRGTKEKKKARLLSQTLGGTRNIRLFVEINRGGRITSRGGGKKQGGKPHNGEKLRTATKYQILGELCKNHGIGKKNKKKEKKGKNCQITTIVKSFCTMCTKS